MITHAPMGKLIKGHVLDCSVRGITRSLQDYDKQLYVIWNPDKLRGHGCWEIRRRPNQLTRIETDHGFYLLEYIENDLENHVLDCGFLNYDAVRKIKSMDTWADPNWITNLEREEAEHRDKQNKKAREEMRYAIRYDKKMYREFKEMLASGLNPNLIADYWK